MRPELFSQTSEVRGYPKCVSTVQQTASFLDAQIVKLRPEPFL